MGPGPLIAVAAAGAFTLPGVLRLGDQTLAAASCATRETLGFNHYVAALYVRAGESAPLAMLDPNRAKALEIGLLSRTFMPLEMPRKYRRALEGSLDEETINRMRVVYRELRAGDAVTIAYLPERGVSVRVNGVTVAASTDHGVVEAVLTAWANGKPVAEELQKAVARHPCRTNVAG